MGFDVGAVMHGLKDQRDDGILLVKEQLKERGGKLRWATTGAVTLAATVATAPWGSLQLVVSSLAQFIIANFLNGARENRVFDRLGLDASPREFNRPTVEISGGGETAAGDHKAKTKGKAATPPAVPASDNGYFDPKVAIVAGAVLGTINRAGLISLRSIIAIGLSVLGGLLNRTHLKERSIALSGTEALVGAVSALVFTCPVFRREL